MSSICDNCCARIYNPKHYNLQGIGNPYYGNCIVIPNVDYDAYKNNNIGYSKQVKAICDLHVSISSTGELQELVYFCPLIRCNELVTCKLDYDSFCKCLTHFGNDVRRYDINKILLLGDAVSRMLDITITDNLNNVFITNDKRMYFVNYSPLIYYKNEKKYKVFVEQLYKWINAVKTKNFSNYNIIRI